MSAPHRRERRGRGPRGELLPPAARVGATQVSLPAWRSPTERFTRLVQQALRDLGPRWGAELEGLRVEIRDVPSSSGAAAADVEVIRDGPGGSGVPLAQTEPGLLVIYRRPLELRAESAHELSELVGDVVLEAVAQLLGVDPDELDPPQG